MPQPSNGTTPSLSSSYAMGCIGKWPRDFYTARENPLCQVNSPGGRLAPFLLEWHKGVVEGQNIRTSRCGKFSHYWAPIRAEQDMDFLFGGKFGELKTNSFCNRTRPRFWNFWKTKYCFGSKFFILIWAFSFKNVSYQRKSFETKSHFETKLKHSIPKISKLSGIFTPTHPMQFLCLSKNISYKDLQSWFEDLKWWRSLSIPWEVVHLVCG